MSFGFSVVFIAVALIVAPISRAQAEGSFLLSSWDRIQDSTFNVTQSEWWYTIGFLTGKNQAGAVRRFGFMINVVRGADAVFTPAPSVLPATTFQVSLIDLDLKSFSAGGFSNYALRGDGNSGTGLRSYFKMSGGGFSLDLTEAPSKKQALFGEAGWVDNASLGKAMYVSRTRQSILPGSFVRWNGEVIEVTGTSWEDHQLTPVEFLQMGT